MRPVPPQIVKNQWKRGSSGNPGGRPPLPPEIRAIRRMDGEELARIISKYLRMPLSEGKKAAKEDLPMGEIWILKCIHEGMRDGDPVKLSVFLDRVVGKTQLAEAFEAAEITTQELVAMLEERFPHLKKSPA